MNRLILFKKLFVLFIGLVTLSACTGNFGKKVTFPGHKGEVYYKGEGVTETDAKATGKFLEENEFFLKDDKTRSVQISKDNGHVKFRMVIDEKGFSQIENADEKFDMLGAMMSKTIFNSTPLDVIYTDDAFKDKKTIAFNPAMLEAANVTAEVKEMKKKPYEHNTLYYGKNVTDNEAEMILNYLVKSEFFTADGSNNLMLTKTANDGAHFRFPVKASFANEAGMQKVDDYAKKLKAEMFAEFPLEFEVLSENLVSLKKFNY